MLKKYSTLLLALFFASSVFSQTTEDYVAKIGYITISPLEFQKRYEFTPTLNKANKNQTERNKLELLLTMSAEKLWALEAERLGMDTTEVMRFVSEQFEKMFARDALFKREVLDKINISDEELEQGYYRYNTKLYVNFLFSEDKEEIDNLYNLLENGIEFDSVLVERPEFEEQPEPIEVVYGQMAADVEDSLYNLQKGNFTHPIYTPDGWYIFYLENKSENPLPANSDKKDTYAAAEKIIKARKIDYYYSIFYKNFFEDKKVDVKRNLYDLLAEKMTTIFKEKYALRGIENDNLLTLEATDVIKLEQQFSPEQLHSPYLQIENDPISLKKFIRLLAFDGFSVKPDEIDKISQYIFAKNRAYIERELLAREAIKRGLNQLPEVQKDIAEWRENYLFQMLYSQFADSVSVSDEEAQNYYNAVNQKTVFPLLVNLIDIYTDDVEIIETVMRKMEEGADIRELALKYSENERVKNNNGETGLIPVTSLGELGSIVEKLDVGEIYGPVKIGRGFSIFKVIDKQEQRIEEPPSFESMKDDIVRKLRSAKLRTKIKNYTTELAKRYGVEINSEALHSVEVTNINSFGYRTLGFGERMTAVPILAPNFEWAEDYFGNLDLIQ